ncbi:MAG: L-threonylcarbamoyladenylate synthase [Acidimicrobiia bacterium]
MNLNQARAALEQGLLVGVPTDTVYGIAADPWSETGVRALFELKGRDPGRPVALLASGLEQAGRVCVLTDGARGLAERFWPGPLTLVTETAAGLPAWIGDRERGTVGVRVPDHQLALRLLAAAGPLAVSSANPSGGDPALDHHQAESIFGDSVAGYLPGECEAGVASTVVDVSREPPLVLRSGPIAID